MGETHDAAAYGSRLADDYDSIYEGVYNTAGAVERLADLAAGGRVLEFGVGTGRVALELSDRDLEVWGVDGSADMLERLRAKPGGDAIGAVEGDFARVEVPGRFELVILLVNTIYALPDQDAQVACFANAARHLMPGGRFVVEAWVPDPPAGDQLGLKARRLAHGLAGLVVEDHDRAAQLLRTTQIVLSETGEVRVFPVVHRYAWPAELDLMARMAGMTLESRWADWSRRPFDANSHDHISVWRRPGTDPADTDPAATDPAATSGPATDGARP